MCHLQVYVTNGLLFKLFDHKIITQKVWFYKIDNILICKLIHHYFLSKKFSDTEIQDVSTSISIKVRIQKNLNDLTERYDDDGDES